MSEDYQLSAQNPIEKNKFSTLNIHLPSRETGYMEKQFLTEFLN